MTNQFGRQRMPEVNHKPDELDLLAHLRQYRGQRAADFTFNRDQANERGESLSPATSARSPHP